MSEVGIENFDGAVQARSAGPDLQLVVDSVPGLVSYLDRNYCFVFANQRHSEWFGRPQSEFAGKTVADVLGTEGFHYAKPFIDQALSGKTATFDRYQKYDGGPPRYERTRIVPDRASNGDVKGVVVLVEDITDRKRAEDAEKELERQLMLLIEASGSLLASPATADVLRTILDLAGRFTEADAYSVWRQEGDRWQMVARRGFVG